jgi:hypothetical protein
MNRKNVSQPSLESLTSSAIGTPNPLSTDDLDLAAFRLSQDFASAAGVRKVITTVPCRKPGNQTFVRVRTGDEWRMPAAVLQLKEDGECYLVAPHLLSELSQEVRPKILYTGVTREGNPFLWPINMPGEDGRLDSWSQSAHNAADIAGMAWIRLVANRSVGAYDVMQATALVEEPTWPELTFKELINLAFRDKVISSLEHPVVKRLRGEI